MGDLLFEQKFRIKVYTSALYGSKKLIVKIKENEIFATFFQIFIL